MKRPEASRFRLKADWLLGLILAAALALAAPLPAQEATVAATALPRVLEIPPGQTASRAEASRAVTLEAEELVYSADCCILLATGKASLRHQGLEISAAGMQYDTLSDRVRAQGQVEASNGEARLQADALSYEVRSRRGIIFRAGPPEEYLTFSGASLVARPESGDSWRSQLEPLKTSETRTWVNARRASVLPGQRLMLERAEIEVDGMKILSLPHFVASPGAAGPNLLNQMMGYSSGAGLRMELPFYYAASESRLGSLRLTHNGGYGAAGLYTPGWALNLEEQYLGARSQGTVNLDDLVGPSRSLRWQHHHSLGPRATADLSFGLLKATEDSPRVTSVSAALGRHLRSGSLSFSLATTSLSGSKQQSASLGFALPPRPLGKSNINCLISTNLTYSRSTFLTPVPVFDGREYYYIPASSQASNLLHGLDVSFLFPNWNLGPKTTVTSSLGGDYLGGDSPGGARASLNARLGLRRELGRMSSLFVDYSFAAVNTQPGPYYYALGRQYLSSTLNLVKGNRWKLSAAGSWDLEAARSYGSLDLSRGLGFGRLGEPRYRVGASAFVSRIPEFDSTYTRLYVARAFPNYLVTLNYSPRATGSLPSHGYFTGSGYEYLFSPGRKIWVEFSLRSF
jgi:hypothetical protein